MWMRVGASKAVDPAQIFEDEATMLKLAQLNVVTPESKRAEDPSSISSTLACNN